jgi:hypothetical protein
MGTPELTHLQARYVPRRLVPGLVAAVAFAAIGVGAALAGLAMGWVLAAFMVWTVANLVRRMRRRAPVLTLDAAGIHDHRIPAEVRWPEVARMRTVDRRVALARVPLLELVPTGPFRRDRRSLVAAVLRGDIAFVDARDDRRLMFDLRHLDVTPEQVLAVARAHRT